MDRFANDPFLESSLGAGMLFKYGVTLEALVRRALKQHKHIPLQQLHLRVFEVSYCKQGSVEQCGPGYFAAPGTSGPRWPGIHPFLYFDFKADSSKFAPAQVFYATFVIPYDAFNWMAGARRVAQGGMQTPTWILGAGGSTHPQSRSW